MECDDEVWENTSLEHGEAPTAKHKTGVLQIEAAWQDLATSELGSVGNSEIDLINT